MKRTLFVLALMLILTVCFVGQAFALNRPWTESDNNTEHPWGGDENLSDPPPVTVKSGSYITYTTGYIAVDIIFRFFILDEFNVIEKSTADIQSYQPRRIPYQKYSTVNREGIRK